jgi:mannan endo-1,4-beta-mannosidase
MSIRVRGIRSALALAAAVATGTALLAAPTSQASGITGFHVSGTKLLDGRGNPFLIRGINHLNAAYRDQTKQAMVDIAATGANTVRLTVTGTGTPMTVKDISGYIAQCRQLKLICILTDQDTSGYGDAGQASISLPQAADFWVSVKSALAGQEAYAIVDIGNLPYGNSNVDKWTADAIAAVQKIRSAGIRETLLVGGPNYGEDTSGVMRTNAPKVFAADTLKNTAFSIAMYASYGTATAVKKYVDAYAIKNLTLVITEFSWAYLPYGAFAGTPKGPDEASIMSYAKQKGVGWAAYAWSRSSPEKGYDDMVVNYSASARTPWGNEVVTGANGLSETSKRASVYK